MKTLAVVIASLALAACAEATTLTGDAQSPPPDSEQPCSDGLVRCDGVCIDPQTDPMHCGASGSCTGASEGESCASSQCEQGVCVPPCAVATTTLMFTGAMQTYLVPPSVARIRIDAQGAQGADGAGGLVPGAGGRGGQAVGTLAVTPGQLLLVFVGGRNGFGGGGLGGTGSNAAGSGGGASDVRTGPANAERVIVAGGGGGGSAGAQGSCTGGAGGPGGMAGGATGAPGGSGTGCVGVTSTGGGPGTATSGGTAGTPGSNCSQAGPGMVGSSGAGGLGGAGIISCGGPFMGAGGGGGGGGYFGGGGGAGGPGGGAGSWGGGGGGGGGSFTGTLTDASTTAGTRTGDGIVSITTICN